MPVRLDTGEPRRPGVTSGPAEAIPAAVLVLIVPERPDRPDDHVRATVPMGDPGWTRDPEAEVILIERAPHGPHPGEISFPGGRAEDGEDAVATALREAIEEVGLDPAAAGVHVLGGLEAFWIPVSGYQVRPVVAIADRPPELTPSPDEVASILRVPLEAFLPGAPIEIVETRIRDFPVRYGAYPIGSHRVWGATARILGQLGAMLG